MQVGQRVRLVMDYHIDWMGAVAAGVTGTVVPWPTPADKPAEVIGLVRLDEPHPLLAEWNNCIWIFDPDQTDDLGWDAWKTVQ